jgi:hypothetical protein
VSYKTGRRLGHKSWSDATRGYKYGLAGEPHSHAKCRERQRGRKAVRDLKMLHGPYERQQTKRIINEHVQELE